MGTVKKMEVNKQEEKMEEFEEEEIETEETDDEYDLINETKHTIRELMRERNKYSAISQEYMVFTQRIYETADALRTLEDAGECAAQRKLAELNIAKTKYELMKLPYGLVKELFET